MRDTLTKRPEAARNSSWKGRGENDRWKKEENLFGNARGMGKKRGGAKREATKRDGGRPSNNSRPRIFYRSEPKGTHVAKAESQSRRGDLLYDICDFHETV